MKKNKDYTLHILISIFLACAFISMPTGAIDQFKAQFTNTHYDLDTDDVIREYTAPVTTDSVWYHNGEVLLPDYVHSDTLIVTDATFLNKWLICNEYNVGGDGDIDDLLHKGCIVYEQIR